jgi:Ca2+:H+ antiporter
LSAVQAFFFALFTILLHGVFLAIQTVRHRNFFVEPRLAGRELEAAEGMIEGKQPTVGEVGGHTTLLILTVVTIVLLAKQLAKLIDHGIAVLGAPVALGGLLIALIVFTPEGMSALRAALDNQLQRSVNLCLGAALSTIGLTVPAILSIGWMTGQPVVLGLDPASSVLLAVTLVLSTLTFSRPRTTSSRVRSISCCIFSP